MRRGTITAIYGNMATVVFGDIGIQKTAQVCKGINAAAGDECIVVFNDTLDDCVIVGVV